MSTEIDRYRFSIDKAMVRFNGQIDTADDSGLIVVGPNQDVLDRLTDERADAEGYHDVLINGALVRQEPALYVNRALLLKNKVKGIDCYSPAMITADPKNLDRFFISLWDMPYEPKTGFTPGYHLAISMKSQTQVAEFGSHEKPLSFGQKGHFTGAVIGSAGSADNSAAKTVAEAIMTEGDVGSHREVIDKGATEVMGQSGLLDIFPRTFDLPLKWNMMGYWHDNMRKDGVPIAGDFPEATGLMLGAAFDRLGTGEEQVVSIRAFATQAVRLAA